jgi:serine/alanine adding enzyme
MQIRLATSADKNPWDSYVLSHPDSTHCHLYGWKDVIEKTYGHKGYYLLAEKDSKIVGALPLIHLKSFLFGNQLVSMPFLNYGGILADSDELVQELIKEALKVAAKLKVSSIELRHLKPISCLHPSTRSNSSNPSNPINSSNPSNSSNPTNPNWLEKTHKVRMVLNLPGSKDELLNSFKAKLRSQIFRPEKEGMKAVIGGGELIDSFFGIFSTNMRDLGSPVHSRRLFQEICSQFPESVKIGVVNYEEVSVAAGLIFCFRDMVEIPWASTLREFNKFSPNMLLYWSLIVYGCDHGFKYFDFGRSTPDEGTYRFKEQWGAFPVPVHWHTLTLNGHALESNWSDKSRYERLIHYWKRLPVPISNIIGPLIRKHISL